MVTDKGTIEKIRKIIAKHYNRLIVSVLGSQSLSEKELKELSDTGYDISNKDSLLSYIYHHSFINHPVDTNAPKSVGEMKNQQKLIGLKPEGEAHKYSVDNLNDKTKQFIDKLKLEAQTRIENVIRDNNDRYKMNALQNMSRSGEMDRLVKESTIGKVKQKLKDTSGEGNRDWMRVAITEISNAVGIASIDRIVVDNQSANHDEIYVYRVIADSKACKWCRRFYQDEDGSPKLYRLSTLVSNGSNYGKKKDDWSPVAGATHPFERCSQTLELKPGWALKGSTPTYIGIDNWRDYIVNKLTA